MQPRNVDITQLLNAWRAGDPQALEQLAQAVEPELRQVAQLYLRREPAGNTLQPTALVNEAYVRLIQWNPGEWQSRTHFYAVAAKVMRRVLVNEALARGRRKRGGSLIRISLTEAGMAPDRGTEVIALEEALKSLAKFDERKSRIVELRFFGGLNAEETAEVLGISERTVHREWDLARAWLFRELNRAIPT
jgi:RNA polymerase sigma-70 factor, ECF subfamily